MQVVVTDKYSINTVPRDNSYWCKLKPAMWHIELRRFNGEPLAEVLAAVDKRFAEWRAASASLKTVVGWLEPGTKCKAEGREKPFEAPPRNWPHKGPIIAAVVKDWEATNARLLSDPKPKCKGKAIAE